MDASKRMVFLFFLTSTIIAWVVFGKTLALLFGTFGIRDAHLLGKQFTTTTLLGAGTAVAMLFWALRHPRIRPGVEEVGDELVKVTWPDADETKAHTRSTVIVTVIIALILWVFDQVFGNLTGLLLG